MALVVGLGWAAKVGLTVRIRLTVEMGLTVENELDSRNGVGCQNKTINFAGVRHSDVLPKASTPLRIQEEATEGGRLEGTLICCSRQMLTLLRNTYCSINCV